MMNEIDDQEMYFYLVQYGLTNVINQWYPEVIDLTSDTDNELDVDLDIEEEMRRNEMGEADLAILDSNLQMEIERDVDHYDHIPDPPSDDEEDQVIYCYTPEQ